MVITSEGNVIIDTGMPSHPGMTNIPEHKELLDQASDNPVTHIIASHAHADHFANADAWLDDNPNAKVIAHWEFVHNQEYLKDLLPFQMPRNHIFYPNDVPNLPRTGYKLLKKVLPQIEPDVLVDNGQTYKFSQGGVDFIVYPTPGAEGSDGVSVWLPQHKILFTGDLFGHIFGMWPNFSTMRGERARYPRPYIDSLNLVLELEPEMLIPSHFYPIMGKAFIRSITEKTRDAVAYVDEAVVDGMNDGKDVYQLMKEIQLPDDLKLNEVHGKVSWGVKSIWESYSSMFHLNSANEMYPVPVSDIYDDVYGLIGAPEKILVKAEALIASGELEQALHLIEIMNIAEPENKKAIQIKINILDKMLVRSEGANHHEKMFLSRLIDKEKERL
ncbi:hypothetical protein CAPTEDRAFT_188586 [Capitella teleta]|uniref:Metallo-beta-lactamase domain-containing protein n=1 Tax=Capitella teleta TaxID=283909 RepID=R7TFE8_CAPTE|nr:hypothetical protein CAPTEDRAFT_188586 [Capitella teleta]|eukprot:ELT92469.1 hypothetical protein CAPTEDRAFT_188586 [Capitella teleta]